MRIFHLSANVYQPLPAAHHTRRIWGELSKGSEQYHIIASSGRLGYSHTVEGNLHLHLLPSIGRRGWPFLLTSWLALILALVHRPDRIIAQCPVNGGFAAVFIGRLLRLPVLLEVHGSHYFRPDRAGPAGAAGHLFYRSIARLSLAFATRIRSLSGDMTEQLVSTFGAGLREKIVEIGNRVDLRVFSPSKTAYRLGGAVTIVSVGAFTRLKGHDALIEHLLSSFPESRLVLVGRGPLHDHYQRRATELGVADRLELRFAPTHEDVARILQGSDIYVHSSLAEGVPRAILEAMAMGLPVVATKVGFLGGVVEDGRDVLLVPPGDPRSLVEAVGALLASEPLRQRLGMAAAATIRERFEWNMVFDRYRALISALKIP